MKYYHILTIFETKHIFYNIERLESVHTIMELWVLWNIMEKKYKLEYYDNEEKTDLCLIGEQNDLPFN